MGFIPEELTTLVSDLETFLSDGLKGENLSKKTKEKREVFLKRIKEVKLGFPQDFKERSGDDSGDDEFDSPNDGGSLHSERTDKDEEASEGVHQAPLIAAQDLPYVFKAGYLEKRRKDHSFFGIEWQKRWCALSSNTFYYYGNEKDKQQKGEFSIDGYIVKLNNTLRKDKKECCFDISASDKRLYQFCASSQKEAEEWVKQIDFVLRDMTGTIPEDEDEDEDEEEQGMYDDVGSVPLPRSTSPLPIDEDIYEELPEEEMASPPKLQTPNQPPVSVDKSTDYPNYYQGMWDCIGDQSDELSFKRGDAIYILSKEYQNFGWWVGEFKGSVGIVPKDFLMQLYAV
ncbi:hypothetical protein NHX12_001068 [Muraenolepis orangiensis]|uniref:Src kinase-associated phosphoprotein 2 n=1 Tax=Muraenolepis orangiensis TaxID=630683 RepID=A0A9Q0E2C8_9TELE|nr:hypothetical protein NHX12_001068 [Muraenolepis orangiensis]